MTLAVERDLAAVAAGITRWLGARRGVDDVTLTRCDRPTGGLSSETLMVDATGRDGATTPSRSSCGWRRRAPGSSPSTTSACRPARRKWPRRTASRSRSRWSSRPIRSGSARRSSSCRRSTGTSPVRCRSATRGSPSPKRARRRSPKSLYDVLAAIHQIDWRAAGLDQAHSGARPRRRARLLGAYLDWYADGAVAGAGPARRARLVCRAPPGDDPPHSFLWGDVRLGNIIFDDDRRPVAVLDWEMTTIGAAEHDLAWYLTLEATQNELFGRAVPGFLDHDAACAYYEARGRPVAPVDSSGSRSSRWCAASAIMTRLAYLQQQAGQDADAPARRQPDPRPAQPPHHGGEHPMTIDRRPQHRPGNARVLPPARLLRPARPAARRSAGVRVRARHQGDHPLPRHPRDQPRPRDVLLRPRRARQRPVARGRARSTGRSSTWTRRATASWRRILNREFTGRAVERMEDEIRARARRLLDAVPAGRGGRSRRRARGAAPGAGDLRPARRPGRRPRRLPPVVRRDDPGLRRSRRAPTGCADATSWSWSPSSSSWPATRRRIPATTSSRCWSAPRSRAGSCPPRSW